ncbi:MAG: bacillolysin, partial [Acidobacteria bacterium]|nr:bacillolysin [Acidobacteriota bacterium]
KGRVFDVNPVARLNDPALQDGNNAAAAVPESAYSVVELQDLAGSGPLIGPNVAISQLEAPSPTPADASQPLLFDRSDPRFEEVNAYFQLDRAQRYLQSLGYAGTRRIIAYPIQVDPHAANGTDNSYYLPEAIAGRGSLYFGDGGTDDAEDSDIMLHEYGHAIEDWIAPLTFAGTSSSQSRALGEGFGDYWAFSSTYDLTVASGRDPFCIADWDARCANDDPSERCGYAAGADCLRRVDGKKTIADYITSDASGTEHRNGEIWSSALRQIFLAIGKRTSDTLVIESHFGVPPNPTFAVMARRMLDVDHLLYGDAHAAAICGAMTLRGIFAAGDCSLSPRGERTLFQSPDRGIAIPENNSAGIVSRLTITKPGTIAKLYVHLDVAHTARGDLRITLVAPDGTQVLLADASLDRAADIHATYGLDAQPAQSLDALRGKPAAGEWQLRIADVHPKDTGTLLDWSLLIQFDGDAPSNSRPAGTGQFIPAVIHAPGANGTNFVSDVRLFNRGALPATVSLIFTPTGADGSTTFSAIRIELAPAEVVALDDVVASAFTMTGMGQLEVTGDPADIVVTSRTYTRGNGGTYGQFIPATPSSSFAWVAQLQSTADFRSNVGFAETAGSAGTVRMTLYDATTSNVISVSDYHLAPFSHAQFPVTAAARMLAELRVIAGNARIAGYGSVLDNRTNDPIFVPGQEPRAGPFAAPVITADGANGTHWRTDIGFAAPSANAAVMLTYADAASGKVGTAFNMVPYNALFPTSAVIAFGALEVDGKDPILVSAKIYTTSPVGTYGQFLPLQPIVQSTPPRDLLQIESSAAFRTNVGAINPTKGEARVRFTLFDAAGRPIGETDRTLRPFETIQFPVGAITAAPVLHGRVHVQLLAGSAYVAWASVVDNVTGDPIFVPGQ